MLAVVHAFFVNLEYILLIKLILELGCLRRWQLGRYLNNSATLLLIDWIKNMFTHTKSNILFTDTFGCTYLSTEGQAWLSYGPSNPCYYCLQLQFIFFFLWWSTWNTWNPCPQVRPRKEKTMTNNNNHQYHDHFLSLYGRDKFSSNLNCWHT